MKKEDGIPQERLVSIIVGGLLWGVKMLGSLVIIAFYSLVAYYLIKDETGQSHVGYAILVGIFLDLTVSIYGEVAKIRKNTTTKKDEYEKINE